MLIKSCLLNLHILCSKVHATIVCGVEFFMLSPLEGIKKLMDEPVHVDIGNNRE